jgi:hypothetical protein
LCRQRRLWPNSPEPVRGCGFRQTRELDLRLILASRVKRRVVDIHVLDDRQVRHLDLFVLGFLLEAAVFLVSSADDRPLVLSVVSPDYVRAVKFPFGFHLAEERLIGFRKNPA